MRIILLNILFLILEINPLFAQNLKLNNSVSKLSTSGTSSVHNWNINAETLTGDGIFVFNRDTLKAIKKLSLFVVVMDLKGEKSGMTKKMLYSLQANKYTLITYQFEKSTKIMHINSNNFKVQAIGNLTIAGITKQISLQLIINVLNNSVRITGEKNLKMTDFNIKPPKALLGILKTDNAVKVNFDVIYQ